MNIGERATIIVQTRVYDEVMEKAAVVLHAAAITDEADMIFGMDMAWVMAASMLRSRINGSGPKIHTVVLSDELALDDRIG